MQSCAFDLKALQTDTGTSDKQVGSNQDLSWMTCCILILLCIHSNSTLSPQYQRFRRRFHADVSCNNELNGILCLVDNRKLYMPPLRSTSWLCATSKTHPNDTISRSTSSTMLPLTSLTAATRTTISTLPPPPPPPPPSLHHHHHLLLHHLNENNSTAGRRRKLFEPSRNWCVRFGCPEDQWRWRREWTRISTWRDKCGAN